MPATAAGALSFHLSISCPPCQTSVITSRSALSPAPRLPAPGLLTDFSRTYVKDCSCLARQGLGLRSRPTSGSITNSSRTYVKDWSCLGEAGPGIEGCANLRVDYRFFTHLRKRLVVLGQGRATWFRQGWSISFASVVYWHTSGGGQS